MPVFVSLSPSPPSLIPIASILPSKLSNHRSPNLSTLFVSFPFSLRIIIFTACSPHSPLLSYFVSPIPHPFFLIFSFFPTPPPLFSFCPPPPPLNSSLRIVISSIHTLHLLVLFQLPSCLALRTTLPTRTHSHPPLLDLPVLLLSADHPHLVSPQFPPTIVSLPITFLFPPHAHLSSHRLIVSPFFFLIVSFVLAVNLTTYKQFRLNSLRNLVVLPIFIASFHI